MKPKNLQEQVNRIHCMMGLNESIDNDRMRNDDLGETNYTLDEKPYSNFDSSDKLLLSIKDRLSNAVLMQDWDLVQEVTNDVFNYVKTGEKPDYKMPGFDDTMNNLDKLTIRESFWNSIFGKPDVKDAAHTQLRSQGYSHMGKDEERKDENYLVFNGQKFYPEQIEYADYQDMGDLPRIEDGKLIIANPSWNL